MLIYRVYHFMKRVFHLEETTYINAFFGSVFSHNRVYHELARSFDTDVNTMYTYFMSCMMVFTSCLAYQLSAVDDDDLFRPVQSSDRSAHFLSNSDVIDVMMLLRGYLQYLLTVDRRYDLNQHFLSAKTQQPGATGSGTERSLAATSGPGTGTSGRLGSPWVPATGTTLSLSLPSFPPPSPSCYLSVLASSVQLFNELCIRNDRRLLLDPQHLVFTNISLADLALASAPRLAAAGGG
jgi:hypothetical protein